MNILNSVMIIFLMMGTGFFLAKRGILNDKSNALFGKIILNLSLPTTILVAFIERFTRSDLVNSILKVLIAYIMMTSSMLIGMLIVKIFKVETKRKSAVINMSMFANTLFIGLPVNVTLFGEESLPHLFIYWFSSATMFWTVGIYNFTKGEEKFSLLESLKKLCTPPLMALFISIVFIVFNIPLPLPIKEAMRKFGSMTTPLAMLFLGTVIQSLDLKKFKLNRDVKIVLIGRFLITPLVSILILSIFGRFIELDTLTKKIFIITGSLPVMTNLAIMSKHYNKDYEFTSLMVGLTTAMCVFTIPIHAYIVEFIYR